MICAFSDLFRKTFSTTEYNKCELKTSNTHHNIASYELLFLQIRIPTDRLATLAYIFVATLCAVREAAMRWRAEPAVSGCFASNKIVYGQTCPSIVIYHGLASETCAKTIERWHILCEAKMCALIWWWAIWTGPNRCFHIL